MKVPKYGVVIPETDEQRMMREAVEHAAQLIATEAKGLTPISTVTPEQMAEHLRSCTCHVGALGALDGRWER